MNKKKPPVLVDDFSLLDCMLRESTKQTAMYRPGPYWEKKAKDAAAGIKEIGIQDFRGSTNNIGTSFADNLFIDIRISKGQGLKEKLARGIMKKFPFNRIYDAQVRWTQSYADLGLTYAQEIISLKERTKMLLEKYVMPYSLLGDCHTKVTVDGEEISLHYLSLLEQHDNIARVIDYKKIRSVFEIGGGFGTHIHLLLSNYPNIKKVLYLDIVPNLYIATQYFKSFYGKAVHDYSSLKDTRQLKFSDNDDLEILCIAPWQIEDFVDSVDLFNNSHSFVEIPEAIVANYAQKIENFKDANKTSIALTSYDKFDLSTSFHPDKLPGFFSSKKFQHFNAATLLDSTRENLYYISSAQK